MLDAGQVSQRIVAAKFKTAYLLSRLYIALYIIIIKGGGYSHGRRVHSYDRGQDSLTA